ncbi:hypothetical protein [Gillisia limnaea]|uniref:Uncharacterized protein n=1 Tax=Gillisia limnaea (strain DSM 15749 / LMG 21470 / R-8282) TaxID=865937 RepID=H2BXW9_GILLR|nr:hypothetical protein [Gillisia limnaea]EHQ02132.1 hypothetical protein Gilli_1478 [Gillisia limnaea DSM 15749]
MKKLLLLLSILTSFSSCAQELTCADFKEGEFLIPADSLNPESYKISRKNGTQLELDENGDEIKINIKYKDDCNYILTYQESQNLDDLANYINNSGGIHIKVLEIKGDTLTYSGLIKNDTLSYEMPGKLIKLD